MSIIYTVLDNISQMSGIKKLLAILSTFFIVSILITGLYLLFRKYNEVGLISIMSIYFILMPRDSFLERKEMRKMEKRMNAVKV
ncbi:hypothetical protein [Nostoc sp. ATCC 53789]|uniref:hypothetical protein n=1 Tax=Nostoc sp. ATCC 53789 TaxID=76335 RepID=UPI000DECAD36|nr:hypothetical protein [Nostoc sp. ATCC 53789]QHG16487.1 hypothetical protein GJB62_11225 [Nostoc sp. ATCC 53789]RCJ30770.1 hypothetical protein A6V25_14560 [Nostoc sp. ATCC 53789]